jgi:hypothetical protein
MSREELETYLTNVRALRASPATTRAKTERAPRKSNPVNQDLLDMI